MSDINKNLHLFDDLPHLEKLQRELWCWPRSRAALMVGAGLSLNATPIAGTKSSFSTWSQLARAMFDELNPLHDSDEEKRKQYLERFLSTSPLKIASEYEAAFERKKLHDLILEKNPDNDFQPGIIHRLLLELPWIDVFTTNYDTLLERTEVQYRNYQPVISPTELTSAFSPRIIKLHGSFPSQIPFIITEEDYRTYPQKFAPFVNTVQQSLLENSFVLVGFSGDDPNFLEWTGWILDELGKHHATIYLVGPLKLRPPQRSLLARRGVTPIDLAPLFPDLAASQNIHAIALEWFVRSLAAAKPPRPDMWPSNKPTRPKITKVAGVPLHSKIHLKDNIVSEPLHRSSEIDVATINAKINDWRSSRLSYPGWLILDFKKCKELYGETIRWGSSIIRSTKSWDSFERLIVLNEVNWRLEISGLPIEKAWIEDIQQALEAGYSGLMSSQSYQVRYLNVEELRISKESIDAWFNLSFALLRSARESYDSDRWKSLLGRVKSIQSRHPAFDDRIAYEESLWMLWNIEHEKLKQFLKTWKPSAESPLANMWKASVLAELDDYESSRLTLTIALSQIRKALRSRGNNVELLSMEGWCLYMMICVEMAEYGFFNQNHVELRQEYGLRWHELNTWDCNPWPRINYFQLALSKTPPINPLNCRTRRPFDVDKSSKTYYSNESARENFLPAFAYIRIFEAIGIPLRIRSVNISTDTLPNACEWMSSFEPYMSLALLLRSGNVKAIKNQSFLGRPKIALMEPDIVKKLSLWCTQIFEREASRCQAPPAQDSAQECIIVTFAEILSQLAFKMENEMIEKSFSLAIKIYSIAHLRANRRIRESLEGWFRQLFESVDTVTLAGWCATLLRAPLFSETLQNVDLHQGDWFEPIQAFPSYRLKRFNQSNPVISEPTSQAIGWLIQRAKSISGNERQYAMLRLWIAFDANTMSQAQISEFGQLLWSDRLPTGIPNLPLFYDHSFLLLPHPSEIDVKRTLKEHIKSLSVNTFIKMSGDGQTISLSLIRQPLFKAIAHASKSIIQIFNQCEDFLEWDANEACWIIEELHKWWDTNRSALESNSFWSDPMSSNLLDEVVFSIKGVLIDAVLPNIKSTDIKATESLLELLERLRARGVYLNEVYPYFAISRKDAFSSLSKLIHQDIESNDLKAVESAANAIHHWAHLFKSKYVDQSCDLVIKSMIDRVLYRRNPGVLTCLNRLADIIEELPEVMSLEVITEIENSLCAWELATSLDSPDYNEEFDDDEKLACRVSLARLVASIIKWRNHLNTELPLPCIITKLKTSFESSSFPEIRHSINFMR